MSNQQFTIPPTLLLPGLQLLAEKREMSQGKQKTLVLTKYLIEECAENFIR